ncbi:hypothetical protein RJ639_001768 [Escallonia herrerae]|uniref:Response regulatory domain-containing protein n=1 Tax=Escallonia herrerae TaxID=1293975 RepID=A0AA88X8M8_9ASTE|nr:hypothetical protein RJ639_001768 [Escallonia herrerae]
MGEVVVSNEGGGVELEKMKEDGSAMSSVVRWEKFLPKMLLRVLLIEADDSTRQIIAALLRKCSYKVAAVSDGLKAWEVLKGRPNSIDLILTEVELPSISGFALLTLITEHEICKNIPVIMMSLHDSVSTVYKCMLRGAADFLVKPLRKNELKNLWQHVWRRQASAGSGNEPQDESDPQQKVEATAENNATSNHSSGYMACIKKNRECIEKGSDAQSSCTRPDLEADGAQLECTQDLSQPKWRNSLCNGTKAQKHEEAVEVNKELLMHDNEAGGKMLTTLHLCCLHKPFSSTNFADIYIQSGSAAAACTNDYTLTWGGETAPDSPQKSANAITEACDNNHVIVNSRREAIDLIGAIDNYCNCSYINSALDCGTNKINSSPQLDLSLRRSNPSGSVNQVTEETRESHRLKHSDASAFSRYVNRTMQPLHSTSASICNQQRDYESNSDKQLSGHALKFNYERQTPAESSQINTLPLTAGQIPFRSAQRKVYPVPVPVRGTTRLSTAYGSVLPPIYCTQSGPSSMPSPGSSGPPESSFQANPFYHFNPESRNSEQVNNMIDQNTSNATGQTEHRQGRKVEKTEDRGHFSSATDQSASSSFCNGTLSHLNSMGSGCNGNANFAPVGRPATRCRNEATLMQDGNSDRSTLREAALNKFRMKRKDRCYEKKVNNHHLCPLHNHFATTCSTVSLNFSWALVKNIHVS